MIGKLHQKIWFWQVLVLCIVIGCMAFREVTGVGPERRRLYNEEEWKNPLPASNRRIINMLKDMDERLKRIEAKLSRREER